MKIFTKVQRIKYYLIKLTFQILNQKIWMSSNKFLIETTSEIAREVGKNLKRTVSRVNNLMMLLQNHHWERRGNYPFFIIKRIPPPQIKFFPLLATNALLIQRKLNQSIMILETLIVMKEVSQSIHASRHLSE